MAYSVGSGDNRHANLTSPNTHSVFLPEPYRSYQVVKSTAIIGAPQGYAVMIHPTGGSTPTPSPSYHTSKLWWTKQRMWLPPPFRFFAGGNLESHHSGFNEAEERLGTVKYQGFEGLVGFKCDIEVSALAVPIAFAHEIKDRNPERRIHIKRKGLGREYDMQLVNPEGGQPSKLIWKGSKAVLGMVHNDGPNCNGNLKLINPEAPERVLAVWKNRTDHLILGALFVFATFDEGKLLEEVVLSCLAIVFAERLSARGWLGGMGKDKQLRADMLTADGNHDHGMPGGSNRSLTAWDFVRGSRY